MSKQDREFRELTDEDILAVEQSMEAFERTNCFRRHPNRQEIMDGFRFMYLRVRTGAHPTTAYSDWVKIIRPNNPIDSETK